MSDITETNFEKAFGYVGLAIRARHIAMGANTVATLRRRPFLYLLCKSAAKNTRGDALALSDNQKVPLIEVCDLARLTSRENCKFCAVTEANIAKAIANAFGESEKAVMIAERVLREASSDKVRVKKDFHGKIRKRIKP